MKRGQRTCDSRPEAARRREPRSKIEAKLQLRRRSNLDAKTKRSAEESPRTPRGKLAESSESLAASSSGNEDCPRFFTSKQRVELVDFEPARISRLPRVVSAIKRSEGAKDGSSRTREDRRGRKTWKSSSQTLVKRTTNLVRGSLSEPHLRQSKKLQINFFSPGIGPPKTFFEEGGKCIEISLKNSHNSIRQLAPQEFHDSSTERRSRSAPSTPLFRIKYAKDKRPKNFLAERKSLAERSLREEIRISRKNRSRGLRLSRSSDVTVSSCDAPPSEQKIIESTTLQDSETREEEPETIFTVENRALEENEEGESLSRDNCEAAETAGCRQEVAIKVIDSEKKLPEDAIIAEENSPAIENLHTNPEILETANIADPVEERKQPVEENANVVSRVLAQEKKEISPRKPPKKRAFKWETILEKQHRQQATLYTQSRENSPTTLRENQEERKSNFWNERTANCSKHCRCPKSRGKSSESKRLEAYSRIREELPKILMKRRHAEAEKRAGKLSQAAKSINMSPERPKQVPEVEKFKFDFLLNENFIGHDDYRYNTRSKRSPVERTSPKISNNVSTNCDLPQKLQIPKDSLKITAEEKKNESYSVIADSSQNCRESVERKCMKMPRASILKHRKTPSPRRVTFLLPGRVMHEHLTEDESLVVESSSDKEGAECCARQNVESEKEDEKIFSEEERSAVSEEENLSRDNSQRRDGNPGAHIMEKAERIRPDNLTKTIGAERSEKARNVGWSSLLAAKEDENERESDDSEQDWETPTAEDPHRSVSDVSFPRETRQAMKILQRARDDSSRHHCRKGTTEREIFQQRNLHPKPENSPETSSTLVAESYARVLAMFQEGCDARESSSRATSSQIRGSRRANEAGETVGSSRNEWRTNGTRVSHDLRPENSRDLRKIVWSRRNEGAMQSNGSEVGNSENGVDRTGWTVGLINGKFKYLTAETFGFKINANGASLKKKQLWTLEGSEHQVFLRSHLDRYLAVDQFGNVTCEAEDPSDPGCAFQIQLASDGSGRWALKNVQRGYFLGSSQDELKCMAKAPGEAEYWLVHLAARPQVNLRSAGRKRFAHLSASQDEIHVDAPVPWGEDTLFTLEFRAAACADSETGPGHGHGGKAEGGHYALHTCNNKYLARDGKLLDSCTRDCLYAAEFHAGLLALRDIHGAYLAPIGSKAVLKSRSTTVTRDELFSLEESLPQASFVAALNQRYVSVKQGVDVTANQDEISGHETFQLEFDRVTKRWYVRTMQDRYWSLEAGGGIQASDHKRSSNALFDLVWQPEDGTVALRANNGKFLATKRSGHLYANADTPDGGDSDASKYYFYLMNRPILVLRCEQGFVGPKSAASPKLECNKAGYETIRVERCERGVVRFKGQNGMYWHADSEGVTVDSEMPSEGFYLELREPSRLCIKCTDGRYLTAGKNGALRLGETAHDSATKWEF